MPEFNSSAQNHLDPNFFIERVDSPGLEYHSSALVLGEQLRLTLEKDPNFYFFSPDETTSNKLSAVYQTSTRAWQLPQQPWDLPSSLDGRVVELLSENALFSCMVGHLLSGGPAMMTSYEAFFSIITSQILQYIKFIVQSENYPYQPKTPAVNLLSTSTCWRQDHNGYSHQSPALISTLLNLPSNKANCLFPVDATAARTAYHFMLNSQNLVNLMTFNKTPEPLWIDSHHANFQLQNGGASIFGFASDHDYQDSKYLLASTQNSENAENTENTEIKTIAPTSFIFTAAGDIVTKEALYALQILRQDLPHIKFRFIGLTALSHGRIGTTDHPLSQATFDQYFGKHSPIIANFHGYPTDLQNILSTYTNKQRIFAHGYSELGSTTTPFQMLSLNSASRYHLCLDVAKLIHRPDLITKYQKILIKNRTYAHQTGTDLPEIQNFKNYYS